MASKALFIDTSAFYAFFDKRDSQHKRVFKILKNSDDVFVTSNYVLDELITLFRVRKLSLAQFEPFINSLWSEESCQLFRVSKDIDLLAWDMLKKLKEHNFSFTDCTSFVLMKNHNIKKVCTLDKHFQIAGFEIAR
ncbi:MAG: type II toxin-antitoxin system VapC family toxin [Candidatus Marinimicrobia bacterium]|nr:type II toxin-antitoxin system VapC family toxin [Candidatus Neomarinimicrobiota bacterium]